MRRDRFLGSIAAVVATVWAAFMSGCQNDIVVFTQPDPPVVDATAIATDKSGQIWHAAEVADLGLIDEDYVTRAFDLAQGGDTRPSFEDFRLVGNGTIASLTGSFRTSALSSRVLGRVYHPHSLGGSGWSSNARERSLLDSGSNFMRDLTLAISDSGNVLSAFWNGSNVSQSAVYRPSIGWTGFLSSALTSPAPGTINIAKTLSTAQSTAGYTNGLAWGPNGSAYLAYPVMNAALTQETVTFARYDAFSGWTAVAAGTPAAQTFTQTAATNAQIEMLGDGIGVTAIVRPRDDSGIRSFWLGLTLGGVTNPYTEVPVDTDDVRNVAAAADRSGNVLVVFLGIKATGVSCDTTTTPVATGCDRRLFASVRTAAGIWTGPSQIDENLVPATTTYRRDNSRGTGSFYPTPGVAYLGSGRFMAAWSVADASARTSKVQVRGYTVGQGWDQDVVTLEEVCLNGSDDCLTDPEISNVTQDLDEIYQVAHDLHLSSDGAGNALLTMQYVLPKTDQLIEDYGLDPDTNVAGDNTAYDRRYLGYKAYVYRGDGGGWGNGQILNELVPSGDPMIPACVMDTAQVTKPNCWEARPNGAVFKNGEAVIAFPAPVSSSSADQPYLRLYTVELR